MNDDREFPSEFEMVFAVDLFGNAIAVQMPENHDIIMDGAYLNDNGFEGHEGLSQGLYRAKGMVWSSTDYETGTVDDFGVDLTDIETIWSPEE